MYHHHGVARNSPHMVAEPGGPRKRIDEQIVELSKTSSETRQKACFDEETSKDDTAKHSSILETAVSRSTLDSEVSSRDRTLQCTVEQILDVPVPETMKQLVEVPETIFEDRTQQRIVKQSLVFQFRRLWRNWWSSPRFSLRTEFNRVLQTRPDHRNPCYFTR